MASLHDNLLNELVEKALRATPRPTIASFGMDGRAESFDADLVQVVHEVVADTPRDARVAIGQAHPATLEFHRVMDNLRAYHGRPDVVVASLIIAIHRRLIRP